MAELLVVDPPPEFAAAATGMEVDLEREPTDEEMEQPVKGTRAAAYDRFFAECNRLLPAAAGVPKLTQYHGRHYGPLRQLDEAAGFPAIWVGLTGPRRGEMRVPVLTFEMPSRVAGQEPSVAGWTRLRSALDGDEWRISFGKHRKARDRLCRCTRDIGPEFSITDDQLGVRESARQAARELLRLWPVLQA